MSEKLQNTKTNLNLLRESSKNKQRNGTMMFLKFSAFISPSKIFLLVEFFTADTFNYCVLFYIIQINNQNLQFQTFTSINLYYYKFSNRNFSQL